MSLSDVVHLPRPERALVVGGATGMGAATAELVHDPGAEVVVMDRAEVTLPGVKAIKRRPARQGARSRPPSTSAAARSHALFSCAGVADGTPGHRADQLHRPPPPHRPAAGRRHAAAGSAIGMISSAAGLGWEANLPLLQDTSPSTTSTPRRRGSQEHGKADYMWSKQAINAYVGPPGVPLLKRGIRINAILPGPTDTPLAQANADLWLGFGADYRGEAGIEASTPRWSRPTRWCSSAATPPATQRRDHRSPTPATSRSGITESFPAATPVVDFLTASPSRCDGRRQCAMADAHMPHLPPCTPSAGCSSPAT